MSKNTRNRILLGVSAILLVCLSVGATLAYLTDTTDTVTNTFSVGNVTFVGGGLDEAAVNEYGEILYKKTADGKTLTADPSEALKDATGEPILADRVITNSYKIIPGHTYVKDPTVHIAAPSEEAYVFVAISYPTLHHTEGVFTKVEAEPAVDYLNISQQIDGNGWDALWKPDPNNSSSYLPVQNEDDWNVYYYENKVKAETDDLHLRIFQEFKVATNAVLPKSKSIRPIQIVAYVVQADGFATPLEAWNATYGATTNP